MKLHSALRVAILNQNIEVIKSELNHSLEKQGYWLVEAYWLAVHAANLSVLKAIVENDTSSNKPFFIYGALWTTLDLLESNEVNKRLELIEIINLTTNTLKGFLKKESSYIKDQCISNHDSTHTLSSPLVKANNSNDSYFTNYFPEMINQNRFDQAINIIKTSITFSKYDKPIQAAYSGLYNLAGITPLHIAVQNNNYEKVIDLISKRNDINAISSLGFTSLHYALMCKNEKILKVLLENGANLDRQSDGGASDLELAMDIINTRQIAERMHLDHINKLDQIRNNILELKYNYIDSHSIRKKIKAIENTSDWTLLSKAHKLTFWADLATRESQLRTQHAFNKNFGLGIHK
jgi:ankyrin repeat protein